MRSLFSLGVAWAMLTAGCALPADAPAPEPSVRAEAAEERRPDSTPAPPCCCENQAEESTVQDTSELLVTPWVEPAKRPRLASLDLSFTDQEGQSVTLAALRGKPVALSFLYTRCTNPRKCPLVADTMARLQEMVRKAALAHDVRLLLITFDPEFDSSAQLKRFAADHGLKFEEPFGFLRPDPSTKMRFFDELKLPVNFNDQGVNLHGIQLILLDNQGRFVRRYQTLIWNNTDVLADLKTLAAEPK
jgi:protein SCO1/2